MIYLLDTNVISTLMKGTSPELSRRFTATPIAEMRLCSIVRAELLFGALRHPNPQRFRPPIDDYFNRIDSLAFSDPCAGHHAKLRLYLQLQGTPIGPNDTLIASIALANNLTLVTNNTREFSRVPDLKIEDWQF